MRAKTNKLKTSLTQIDLQEISIKEKVKRISHQQGSELRKTLLKASGEADRALKIFEQIQENKYLILDFMEQNESPTPDFLKIVISLE